MDETELGSVHGSQATGTRPSDPRRLARGEVVGRYVVVEELGAGGMGVVYSAYDPELDRRIALKLLSPRGGGDGDSKASRSRARLIREAQALAKLSHNNVVTVHDVGEHEGRVFLAMEYLDGITLRAWIANGPHRWPEVIEVLSAAGHGLMAAHATDMTHRDFKPDNVMLCGSEPTQRVVVTDFGLATVPSTPLDVPYLETSTSSSLAASVDLNALTRTGAVMGTPAYMAPEQHRGIADGHADQFSFCVTLYEALYGERPFAGKTLPEILTAATYGEIRSAPPGDGVPRWVRDAVVRGLQADPSARWPDMASLLDALHDNPSRKRWLAAGIGGIALAAAAVYGVGLYQDQRLKSGCASEAAVLEEVWGDSQRQQVSAAFARSPLAYAGSSWSRAEPQLDAQTQRWASLRMSSCLSRAALDPGVRDIQDACFESRKRRVHNAVEMLSTPDPGIIQRAVELTELDTQLCVDERWLRSAPPIPTDPEARARQQSLHEDLDFGRALARAGRLEDAVSHQSGLITAAIEADERHIAAAARLELGEALLKLKRLSEGAATVEDAYFEAHRLSLDTVAAAAAQSLVTAHGQGLADAPTGRMWARHAQLLIDPTEEPLLQARLDLMRARLELTAGNYRVAAELAEPILATFESEYGAYSINTQDVQEVLLRTYDRLGRHKESLRIAKEILAARQDGLGPSHPRTLDAHNNLAAALLADGSYEEAEKSARASLGTGKEPDLSAAERMDNLSIALRQQSRLDEALALNEDVLDIRREQLPRRHLQIAHTLVNRSAMLYSANRVEDISPLIEEAIEIYLEQGGPMSPYLANTYRLMGGVHGTAGDYERAVESFQSAARTQARILGPKHPGTIMVHIELAQAVLQQGDYVKTIELTDPWVEEATTRSDLLPGVLIPLHAVHGRAHLLAGDPARAKTSLELALELAPHDDFHVSWVPSLEIDLARLRWKSTPEKEAAILDVEAALARLKAREDADPLEIERAQTWLEQTQPRR